jgi:hypothetical protein
LHRCIDHFQGASPKLRRCGARAARQPIREGALSFRRNYQDNGDSIDNYDGSVTKEIRASLEISSTAFAQSKDLLTGGALPSLMPPSVMF